MAHLSRPARLHVRLVPLVRAAVEAAVTAHTRRIVICPDVASADLVLLDETEATYWQRHHPPVIALARGPIDRAVIDNPTLGDVPLLAGDLDPRSLVADLLSALETGRTRSGPGHPGVELTDREDEVLHLICRGLSNDEIARLLFLSINSVKSHIRTLYRKIEVERRPQAVLWGMARGYGGTDGPATP